MAHSLQTGDSNLVAMRTSEDALQMHGCGHALETPIMYWKLLIEVRCRDIILRLADFPSSLLQLCHTKKTVCFGGVNLMHLSFHLTATNGMPFDDGANAEWPAAHHHRGF